MRVTETAFAAFGEALLGFVGISMAAFRVAGGALLFLTALDMLFDRRTQAPNGEDYLYVFYNRLSGTYMLMSYNIIEQAVDSPIISPAIFT